MYLKYPVDRLASQLFQGNVPPNIAYNTINVAPQLVPALPYVAHALATVLSERAMINPLRVYVFNKYSDTGFNNADFFALIIATVDICARNNTDFNNYGAIKSMAEIIVNHYCAIEYRDNMQVFTQLLDQQTSAQLYEYLSRNNLLGNVMQNPGIAGNGYQMGMQVIPGGNGIQVNSGYTGSSYISAPSSNIVDNDDRYSTNIYGGDKTVDRSQHNMGYQEVKEKPVNVPAVNRQINTVAMREEDIPAPIDTNVKLIRTNGEGIECEESFGSFSDLADKVFTDHEHFFKENSHFDFNYIRMNNYEYSVGLAPFTNEILSLNLKDKLVQFFNGTISSVELNNLILKTPRRLAKILNMFFDNIKLMVNNLLAVSKCGTRFDDKSNVIDDMHDLIISVKSKGREELLTDLKIALELWVNDLFDIREFVSTDEEGKESTCYKAMTKVDVVIVNLTSTQLEQYTHRQLDFLCEMRSLCIYIVTTNNVLYSVTFCSQYVDGVLRHFVPIELKRLISLY